LPTILAGLHVVTERLPLEGCQQVADMLMTHSLFHFRGHARSYNESSKPGAYAKAKERLRETWQRFLQWWSDRLDIAGAFSIMP